MKTPKFSDTSYNSKDRQYVLLDSNIIQYSVDKFAHAIFEEYLSNLIEKKHILSVSSISVFELTKGATEKNEQKVMEKLATFPHRGLSESILLVAAQLETLYKMEAIEPKQIESGDKFIAAIAILTGSVICTANARDFPSPYFQEIEREPLLYKLKNRSRCILVSLLIPDIAMINQKFKDR
jgi:predicted nucleic acid-binding protein